MRGLSSLAGRCYGIVPQITDVDAALTRQVSTIAHDGGWRGAAASAFSSAWDSDSAAGRQLAGAWEHIGDLVDALAVELAGLENALEEAARGVEQQGVAVDPATGSPVPAIAAGGLTGPAAQAAVTRGQLAAEYADFRAQTLDQARAARAATAGELQAVAEKLLPAPGSRDWGEGVNVVDGARALWAVPTIYRLSLEEQLPELEAQVATTQRAAWQELIAARKVMGNAARLSTSTRDLAGAARQEEAALEGKIDTALGSETRGTQLAAGDPDGLDGLADGADGLASVARGLVRGIPYAGTAAAAGLTIYQDMQQGESWYHATADGLVSNGAALGAGVAVTAFAGAALGGSLVAVGGGVLIGGVAAVGVGDFVHNLFQENWQADWHQDGVVDGTVHGVADGYDKTRHDLAHMWDDLF
jgi:uncharacterized protein YukE